MAPLVVSAGTAVSALGRGLGAHAEALLARRGGLRPNDFEPPVGGWIGRVTGVEDYLVPARLATYDCRNNRLAAIALATDGFAEAVVAARAVYGAGRIAVVLGTSTSGITAAEQAYCQRGPGDGALPAFFDYDHTQDLGSLTRFVRAPRPARTRGHGVDRLRLLGAQLHRRSAPDRHRRLRRGGSGRRR
jgi:3-oxoacyl-[acyl-carrier-protein] synthase I